MKYLLHCTLILSVLATQAMAQTASWKKLGNWVPGVTGPSDREHPTIWISPNQPKKLNLFGGQNFSSPQESTNDFWIFDLKSNQWTLGSQKGQAPAVLGRVAVDPMTSFAYIYGGHKDGVVGAKIYEGSITKEIVTWTEVKSSIPDFPGFPNELSSFVYDSGIKVFFTSLGLHIDIHNESFALGLNENQKTTWWSLLENSEKEKPAARYGFAYAYDQKKGLFYIFSGQVAPDSVAGQSVFKQPEDTWVMDLAQMKSGDPKIGWKKLNIKSAPARRNGCWAHDTDQNIFYVWSGTADGKTAIPGLYALNLNTVSEGWKLVKNANVEAPARGSCVGLYDQSQKRLIFGFGNSLEPDQSKIKPFTDLWEVSVK